MAKTLTFEVPESEAAALEAALAKCIAEMELANERMKQDQDEINKLKAETQVIAAQTRTILEQLEAAA